MDRSKIFWNIEKKEEEKEAIITLYGTIGSNKCSDDVVDKHVMVKQNGNIRIQRN